MDIITPTDWPDFELIDTGGREKLERFGKGEVVIVGFSSLIGENLVKSHFGSDRNIQSGEFYFPDRAGRNLPLGTYSRFF